MQEPHPDSSAVERRLMRFAVGAEGRKFEPSSGWVFFEDNLKTIAEVWDALESAGIKLMGAQGLRVSFLERREFADRRQDLAEPDYIQIQIHNKKMYIGLKLTDLTEDELAQICAIIRK